VASFEMSLHNAEFEPDGVIVSENR